jgi:Ca2+-binding RTX toxin-like protein
MIVETMEGRTLFSVTVSEGYPGFYDIVGDDADDAIHVSVDMAAETFTLDGVTYGGVAYISVLSGGGHDSISLAGSSDEGYITAGVDAGPGDDSISINFDGSVWAGDGDDTLDLSDAFRGEVWGHAGNDSILVHGECVEPEIHGGDGDDYIDTTGNQYGVAIYGDAGADVIYGSEYCDQIYGGTGADVLHGNGGNDVFFASGDNAADQVYGGGGSDRLYSNGYEADIVAVEHVI